MSSSYMDAAVETARTQIASLASEQAPRRAFLRLAFYDAILHNCVGPKRSLRFDLPHDVQGAVSQLERLKKEFTNVSSDLSYADLYQLAGVEAIKSISGIEIKFKPGRHDSVNHLPVEILRKFELLRNFTLAQEGDDAVLVRKIFEPLGFSDEEIVALFSAIIYTVDASLFETTGTIDLCAIYKELIKKFTGEVIPKVKEALNIDPNRQATSTTSNDVSSSQPSTKGTTPSDNSKTKSLDKIASNAAKSFTHWRCLVSDPSFRRYVDLFAQDKDQFKKVYQSAHEKLLGLGFLPFSKLEYQEATHGIAFAIGMAVLVGVLGFFYETMRT